ncbi:class I SAM-dependent methyltransferase [Paenibacillus harenae]|uniref:class I SAM-dependent methyltransferase n=1 Tax=Paenibacillus harenae TaxID=306543 RepID=UPI0027936F0E|nr:DUF1698 domain-containing protein [Paenibacillus harenae]MDQ0061674.1 2-polyprenyl-3-methyl-5-hydroxy-6-metoxy-1,4-benzoquinol methylase [Paenibacillus harenae]
MTNNTIEEVLLQKFNYYKTYNLKGISAENFKKTIMDKIDTVDFEQEGYKKEEVNRQRELSVKFHWGHNHDFGEFSIAGRMSNRHILVMANFCRLFHLNLDMFRNKEVFDIGCWTGGTTLLLSSLGCKVYSIEEVKKYADTASFLAKSFQLKNTTVEHRSLYSCNESVLHNKFDIVYFPGVLYHVSDPVLALRILYNSLRLNGRILIESMGIKHSEPYCLFGGSYGQTNGGTNWFVFSPSALEKMLKEAGFDQIKTGFINDRLYAYAEKVEEKGICKAGLADPTIK